MVQLGHFCASLPEFLASFERVLDNRNNFQAEEMHRTPFYPCQNQVILVHLTVGFSSNVTYLYLPYSSSRSLARFTPTAP